MKKILFGLVLLMIIALAAVYMIIPGRPQLNASISVKAALTGVFRTLSNDSNWKKWWPGEKAFSFNEKTYVIRAYHLNAFDITIAEKDDSLASRMTFVFLDTDSMLVNWHAELKDNSNPLKRFFNYRKAKDAEKDLQVILKELKKFAEKTENIYGIRVIKTKVADSVLISTRGSFRHKPETHHIDSLIRSLRNYIRQNDAEEKNLPMLNITQVDSSYYDVMTAIAVDRELPTTNQFAAKLMLKGGNILEAEIKGGPYTIENALNVLEIYRSDHKYTSPAIPFQLLVTDRAKETDTTKWITKLYYPIF